MAKIAIYGGRDPRDVPMYRLAEAAGLLRVPASTLRSWTKGQDYKVQGERRRFQEGQVAMREVVETSLKRIDRDTRGVVARLYPWRKSPEEERVIELDPARALGRAVLVGTGISIDVLKARRRAGDSVKRLARDYAVGESKVAAVVAWDERQAA